MFDRTLLADFFVPGVPVTQGSAKAFVIPGKKDSFGKEIRKPRAIVTHDKREDLNAWRSRVAAFAFAGKKSSPSPSDIVAFELSVVFFLPRPATVTKKKRPFPTAKIDLDKLLRSVLDGLTGVLFDDDGGVTAVTANKLYADEGAQVGASISVWALCRPAAPAAS